MPTAAVKPIRILLVDDHALTREGLRMLIESRPGLTIVGEAANIQEAVAAAKREQPDIVLLDLDLGGANALDVLPDILLTAPVARVLIMTGVRNQEFHRRAVRLGAMGLIRKEQATEVLLQAIVKVYQGEVWLDRALVARVLGEITRVGATQPADPEAVKIATLTAREREVIAVVGQGLKNQQIADRLCISAATVGHHLTSIFAKLEVADRLALVVYAYQHRLARFTRPSAPSTPPVGTPVPPHHHSR